MNENIDKLMAEMKALADKNNETLIDFRKYLEILIEKHSQEVNP